jgi:hypothetical protein
VPSSVLVAQGRWPYSRICARAEKEIISYCYNQWPDFQISSSRSVLLIVTGSILRDDEIGTDLKA